MPSVSNDRANSAPTAATLEARRAPIDYEHYLTRQLQPVADGILPFVQDDFATLTSAQQTLF